jgi:DNA-binding NarL/FixJ family response regulator
VPGLKGTDLLLRVQASASTLRVIIVTEDDPESFRDPVPGMRAAAILFKPYTLSEFLTVVRSVLEGGLP